LPDVGHDHFSDSELAKAAGMKIERITRKSIVGPRNEIKTRKCFIEIQFRKKFFSVQ
jgi:hypothetical protein